MKSLACEPKGKSAIGVRAGPPALVAGFLLCFPAAVSANPEISDLEILEEVTVRLVQGADGQISMLFNDQRFAFKGDLYDLWHGEKLDTLEKYRLSQYRMDLDNTGLIDQMYVIETHPDQEAQITVFTDPRCATCEGLKKRLAREDIPARFIPVGVLGPESDQQVQAQFCGETPVANCDLGRYQRNLQVFDLFNIQGIPTVTNRYGVRYEGIPGDLDGFIGLAFHPSQKGGEVASETKEKLSEGVLPVTMPASVFD